MTDELMLIKKSTLISIADKIREKKKTTDAISVTEFVDELDTLPADLNTCSNFIVSPTEDSLTVTLNMDGDKMWGDGTVDSETSHTYSRAGTYSIVCNGSDLSQYIFGQSSDIPDNTVTNICLSNNTTSIKQRAFQNCNSLMNVVIPDSVIRIGDWAFLNCKSLTNITIPDSVTSIGNSAFSNCTNLTNIYYQGDIESWCKFSELPKLMEYCAPIKNLYLNDELITELIIPDSVTSINKHTFSRCTSLTSVVIPDSVTSIGYSAFSYCASLTSVKIPDNVTSIDSFAFAYTGLTSITIPDSVTSISPSLFYGCTSLTSITIPDSVTSIGSFAFNNCDSLTSIVIPDGIISIGQGVFRGCRGLTSVTISDNVTAICINAFYGCSNLTNIVIPHSVISIEDSVFTHCDSLTNVYFKGTAEEWDVISIGSSNDPLTNATRYYYSETEPALNAEGTAYDGNYWHYDENGEVVVWTYTA